ncbi:MAG: hypothetical protein O3B86_18510 [Planctomycetota bacterium]|nr:hypothetical protein [Planctomycetota bacterium]
MAARVFAETLVKLRLAPGSLYRISVLSNVWLEQDLTIIGTIPTACVCRVE